MRAPWPTTRRRLAAWLAGAAVAVGVAVIGGGLLVAPYAVPEFADVRSQWRGADAWLLARDGERLSRLRIDRARRRGEWVALADVSPAMVAAVVAAEDRRFQTHGGVDWAGVLGAVRQSSRGERRGASTLTMQLAAQLEPALERGGRRGLVDKWRQARQALAIERAWSKDEILEAWLNLVPFRGEIEGIDAASRAIAGKRPGGLDRAESAVLAALVRAPNAPPEIVARRACALADNDRETCNESNRLAFLGLGTGLAHPRLKSEGDAPHLASRLLCYTGDRPLCDIVTTKGSVPGVVVSTLDARLQRFAAQSLQRHLRELEGRNVRDGAVVVIDNASGDVLAYVGSSGELSNAPEVDGAAARRLAGSTLKPFLYGLAIERKLLTAASLLDDSPLAVPTRAGLYVPQNYDRSFRGPVTLRVALAASLNVPAVRTLQLVGQTPFHARLRALGLTTLDRDAEHYGDGLALGGGEITLVDLANAYRALANGGCVAPVRYRRDDPVVACTPVIDPRAAFVVGDILADPAARATTFGLSSALATTYPASVKTGTSKDMRDNWAVGFTQRFTVGVWVGNFSGEAMHDVSGVSGAAPVWRDVLDEAMRGVPAVAPAPPAGLLHASTHFGTLAPDRDEWFLEGTQVARVVQVAGNPNGASLESPSDGATFALDPDIPLTRQKILLRARGTVDAARFLLPGGAKIAADEPFLWTPKPGRHVVTLLDAAGRELDRATFVVRP